MGGQLLAGVSRSFYLTLKALPDGLREPLSLAYLLARAADTMADTYSIAAPLRLELLAEFDRLLQSNQIDPAAEQNLHERLKQDFIPLQEDADEALLLQRLPEALQAFRSLPEVDIQAMRGVLKPILEGQQLDIQRFPQDGQVHALETAEDLDTYTWQVAGCVGEYWTLLCEAKITDVFAPGITGEQMRAWGVRYGKGLQLVNILRDIGKDAGLGRCYFPLSEIAEHGLDLQQIKANPAVLKPVTEKWLILCRQHLDCGLQYVESLTSRRLRYATALPLLLGFRTVALLEKATSAEWVAGVKVPRSETAKLLLDAGFAAATSKGIRKLAARLS